MSTNLVINGVTYPFPAVGERPWAQAIINWATAATAGMLQKSGGTFTLTAEVNFGGTYGLKGPYYKSASSNIASAGILRMANNEGIAWRNAANDADIVLKADGSDLPQFGSDELATHKTVSKTVYGYLVGVTSAIQTQLNAKLTDPLTTEGDLVYRTGGSTTRLPIGSTNQVLKVAAGIPTWGTLSGTGDVVGPSSAVDGDMVAFDGVTGKIIKVTGGPPVAFANASLAAVTTFPTTQANLAIDAYTRTTGTTVGVRGVALSASSSGANSDSTSFSDITNLSVTITTSGRPVFLSLISDGSGQDSYLGIRKATADNVSQIDGVFQFVRGSTSLGTQQLALKYPSDTSTDHRSDVPLAAMTMIDFPAAGTYTYKAQFKVYNAHERVYCAYAKLVAFEL